MIAPESASAEVIGSGTGDHRYLARPARCFGIDRRDNDPDLFHHIGTRENDGPCAIFVASIVHIDAVARRIHVTKASAGHVSERARVITHDSRHVLNDVEYVAGDRGKFADFVFGKNSTDGVR